MMLDSLDQAFLDRWHHAAPAAIVERGDAGTAIVDAMTAAPSVAMAPAPPVEAAPMTDFVDRLIAAAPEQWDAVVREVEDARHRGLRTIAIVACERGAGCSTFVEGLVRLLRGRGRDAIACTPDEIPEGPTHDKRIVLVDGGIWFPPGRIHRQRLLLTTSGCDAAILVVRAGHRTPATWDSALTAIGVVPLVEVLSFVPADGSDLSPSASAG